MIAFASACIVTVSLVACTDETADFSYDKIRLAFDLQRPGTGRERSDLPNHTDDMANAVIAAAAGIRRDRELAVASSDELIVATMPGWGLGWEWDAFGDKSINPADTVYGITTGWAVIGLAEAYGLTGDQRYIDTAVSALEAYQTKLTNTQNGLFFWYSDQVPDAQNVHNVNAWLAAAYCIVGKLTNRNDFINLTRKSISELLTHQQEDGSWQYLDINHSSKKRTRLNDAVHAAYIVEALYLVQPCMEGTIDNLPLAAEHLATFVKDGILYEMPDGTLRARSWGLGMVIAALKHVGREKLATQLVSTISDYEFEPNKYLYSWKGDEPEQKIRATAHLLYGLAVLGAGKDGPISE